MKKHTKLYLDYFGYDISSWIECEMPDCHQQAVDINHIECRGMGGSKKKDYIENLMAVCRGCHVKYGDKKEHIEYLKEIHLNNLNY